MKNKKIQKQSLQKIIDFQRRTNYKEEDIIKESNNSVIIKSSIYNFINSLLFENKKVDILTVEDSETAYTLSKVNKKYMVTRNIINDKEARYTRFAILTKDDIKMFKDINKPTEKELLNLGLFLSSEKGAFGV